MPVTPVTDLIVKGNDLVISTQGRGFWVLDDMSPLRALGSDGSRLHGLRPALDSAARRGGRQGQRAAALVQAISQWEAGAVAREVEDGNDRVDFGGRPAFDLIVAIAWLDGSDPPVTSGFFNVARDLSARWAALDNAGRGLGAQAAAVLGSRTH